MECPSCGAEITEILARHDYAIEYSEEQEHWIKDTGNVTYSCGVCLEELDISDITVILLVVDEL